MDKTGNIEIFRNRLSTKDTSDFVIEYAIAPSCQTVNAAYYSQVNRVHRCYKNVVINLDWAVRPVKEIRMFIIYETCNTIFAIMRAIIESAVHPSLLSRR